MRSVVGSGDGLDTSTRLWYSERQSCPSWWPLAATGGYSFLQRIAVFLDYQNVYMQTRRRFFNARAPFTAGQLAPGRLGRLLAKRSPDGSSRVLVQVRVYRGMPSAVHDPRSHWACARQLDAWQADPAVAVVARPLRYPRDFPRSRPQEKGIDVRLAIDFVEMAIDGSFDVGVLVSADTDLVPALEAVARLRGPRSCEVAAWYGATPRLRIPAATLWCHYLTAADHAAVADPRDYTRP